MRKHILLGLIAFVPALLQAGVVNRCPTASASSLTMAQNLTVSFQLQASDPDGDALQFQVTSAPAHGVVVVNVQTGAASYTPASGYCGPDSFQFRVTDGQCNSASATVSITVSCGNQCPTPSVTVSPATQFTTNQTNIIVIAANNSNACVVLDGSGSSDPDGDALSFVWREPPNPVPIATQAIVTNCLSVGTHIILFVVDDGTCRVTTTVTIEVISPCHAVGIVIALVENSSLPLNRKRPLIASLNAACASFDAGHLIPGINQLQAFQNKVQTQVAPSDPALAQQLIAAAQAIIDALSGP